MVSTTMPPSEHNGPCVSDLPSDSDMELDDAESDVHYTYTGMSREDISIRLKETFVLCMAPTKGSSVPI